jgi:hypothetical protein
MYGGIKYSGFQMKPWLEEMYEIRRGWSSSPMLIVVHFSVEIAGLRRLSLLRWVAFRFPAECDV